MLEDDRSYTLMLSSSDGGVITQNSTLVIEDDDSKTHLFSLGKKLDT